MDKTLLVTVLTDDGVELGSFVYVPKDGVPVEQIVAKIVKGEIDHRPEYLPF